MIDSFAFYKHYADSLTPDRLSNLYCMPLWRIFHLYHGHQLYWLRKPIQITHEKRSSFRESPTYFIKYICIEYTLPRTKIRNGTYSTIKNMVLPKLSTASIGTNGTNRYNLTTMLSHYVINFFIASFSKTKKKRIMYLISVHLQILLY